ncbi:MAG: SH3 domain-containing protein [Bdellovibrionales bacterium]|jgi:hypothetical protein|nr:SH3 domain-containing protein [Bdellovibrionales bacterium]
MLSKAAVLAAFVLPLSLSDAALAVATARATVGTKRSVPERAPATAAPKQTPNRSSNRAVVIAPETQIYARPDLDAPVIAVVRQGTKLPVSRGVRGEFAKFHRTRVQGKIGWVVTIDVRSEKEAEKLFAQAKEQELGKGPFAEDSQTPKERRAAEPMVFSRSLGFTLGMLRYREELGGKTQSADLLTYGLKMTGPDVLFTGPLLDFNIAFHYGAPKYYEGLSATKPSGFFMWTDLHLFFPVRMREDSLIAIGAGPVFVISNVQTTGAGREGWRLNVGGAVELSGGLRFGEFIVRAEGKYIFENKSYPQAQLVLQTLF